jgi:hypothetical protein
MPGKINNQNKEDYFNSFDKKIKLYVDSLPIKVVFASYEYGVFFKFKFNDRIIEKSFDINFDYPVSEMVICIDDQLQQFFPIFSYIKVEERYLTKEEILSKLKKNPRENVVKLSAEKLFSEQFFPYMIHKIHSRDRNLIVRDMNTGIDYKYRYHKVDDIYDLIQQKSMTERYIYVKEDCKLIGEYKHSFRITVRYDKEQMLNFFKINAKKLNLNIKYNDKGYWEWDRYNIYFKNNKIKKECFEYLKNLNGGFLWE